MCTGRELQDLVPSERECVLVEDEGCKDFLQHIFKRREDGSFKSTIKKVMLAPVQPHSSFISTLSLSI